MLVVGLQAAFKRRHDDGAASRAKPLILRSLKPGGTRPGTTMLGIFCRFGRGASIVL
jgi:hypothetical protein